VNYAIFFAGSGQEVRDTKLVYHDWATRLASCGYSTLLCDGVGKFAGTSGTTGSGWAKIIQHAMTWLEAGAKGGGNPEKVVVVGMSRGGVQAVICANCLKTKFPRAQVFVFAIDPVQGYHAVNEGSFDLRADRKWFSSLRARESRDELRDAYGLTADAPKTIPDNVVMYLSVLAQFRGSDRGMKWGFTPQSPTLQNMTCRAQFSKVYELPGDHSSGVQSGKNSDGSAHANASSRHARGLVTWEMFSHWLVQQGFARVTRVGEFTALDKYCLIANEDLAGVQIDGNQSGFSFLRASKFDGFDATADSRFLKGRGHLVPSSQVADGRGCFVNERHWDIYQAVRAPLRIEARNPRSGILAQCPNILPWLASRKGFSRVSWADIETLLSW
jgi:hypothetical protein